MKENVGCLKGSAMAAALNAGKVASFIQAYLQTLTLNLECGTYHALTVEYLIQNWNTVSYKSVMLHLFCH